MGERLFGIRNINQILDWLQTHSHLPLLLPNQLMSEEVAAEGYRYNTPVGREGQRERSGFQAGEEEGALAQRRDMDPQLGQTSEGSDSSHDRPASPHSPHQDRTRPRQPLHHDVEMGGSGSSGSGTESHGNESHGNESVGSSSGNCKDSALLESSASNKSSNSHSPSPPSSSNAFSLVSSEQDNPSTSGCSSEQSAKAKTQKELFKTLKQLKTHLPSEKRSKCKSSTLNTLKYALRCVKQVKANEEYYQMMMMINDSQPPGLDVSSYTTEEISSITSEYTLKKNDIFAVAVSLITGKIVYISDQAESILNCKLEVFGGTKFVEFLTPQDVSVFYSFTSPYRLPSWSMCTGAESSPAECMQEKSFFCRISGGKEREGDLQYYPFRMTPYLMKVQEPKLVAEQFCCLLLAERVHSGYEAPRIPTDKRIFTTTHTPSCVFQDVDEKAVPLLGYLPQDLIGSPVLLKMHPSDRPLMLAVHRKILQYGSQPFDHSSIRFCARNGEYVTLDTSWSSFVNPWSRKVSFVIGRHKVRMGPVNEDVFAVPAYTGGKIMDSDIQEITEQIHRLLLQPVHRMGSSGYGSNGSHEQHLSVGSSSESNGHGHGSGNAARSATGEPGKAKPRTFQEICKGVSLLKNQDPHVYLASPSPSPHTPKPEQRKATDVSQKSRLKESLLPLLVKDSTAASVEDLIYKDQSAYSYQQISCLDSVMRYLESCNIPITVKRKYQFSSNTNSSDEDKKGSENHMEAPQDGLLLEAEPGLSTMKAPKKLPPGAPMAALTLPSKAESVVSITSQCSYSSTIVHVGDKKPQPESEMIEDAAESPAPPALPVCVVSPPAQEKESYKRLGLTKQVLAAHTQKEEQAFLMRCRELRNATTFQKDCSTYLHKQRGPAHTGEAAGTRGATRLCSAQPETSNKKGGRNRKSKKPRMKRPDSSDSAVSNRKPRPPLQGLNQTSWSPSEASQSAFNVPYPAIVPAYPLSVYPAAPSAPTVVAQPDPSLSTGFGEVQANQAPPAVPHYPTPMVPPVVALVLPNYLFPQIGQMASAPRSAFFPEQPACQSQPAYATPLPFQTPHAYAAQPPFSAQSAYSTQQPFQNTQTPFATLPTPSFPGPQTAYSTQPPFATTSSFPVQTRFVSPAPYPSQVFPYALSSEQPKGLAMEPQEGAAWRCSTPASLGREPPASPPLFESRCSSPLQLNLLSMEETQRSAERFDITAPTGGTAGYSTAEKASPGTKEDLVQTEPVGDGAHSDGHSSSSDLLDILFHQDSHSGTGSATSESLDSGSRLGNGSGTLASRVSGNRTGSSNTSKFFDCVDCLEHDSKTNPQSQLQAGGRRSGSEGSQASRDRELFQFVPQEPHWLLMANADDNVMMTYELPPRDIQQVLWEDKNRLRQMQKSQPHFTSDQRRELVDEHPWMRRGGLPSSINVQECLYCLDAETGPGEEDLPGMETNPQEVGNHQATAPEEPRPGPEPVH